MKTKYSLIIIGLVAIGVLYACQSANAAENAAQQAAQSVQNGTAIDNAVSGAFSSWWATSFLNPMTWG